MKISVFKLDLKMVKKPKDFVQNKNCSNYATNTDKTTIVKTGNKNYQLYTR